MTRFKVFELINVLQALPQEDKDLEVEYISLPALNDSDLWQLPKVEKIVPKPFIRITQYRKFSGVRIEHGGGGKKR